MGKAIEAHSTVSVLFNFIGPVVYTERESAARQPDGTHPKQEICSQAVYGLVWSYAQVARMNGRPLTSARVKHVAWVASGGWDGISNGMWRLHDVPAGRSAVPR